MLQITAVNTGLFIFNGLRPLRDFGFTVLLGWRDWIRILTGLAVAVVTLLPMGYATGCIKKNTSNPRFEWALAHFCTTLVLVSLPQELLFRGVIQNLLHSRLESNSEIREYTSDDKKEAFNLNEYPRYNAVVTSDIEYRGDVQARLVTEQVDTHTISYEELHKHFYSRFHESLEKTTTTSLIQRAVLLAPSSDSPRLGCTNNYINLIRHRGTTNIFNEVYYS